MQNRIMTHSKDRYIVSSFFWNILTKILNAIFGFVSVPLLLGYFGKADYGLLAIATACNGYMSLMDLGMNVGAVKFFSQWEAEGKKTLVHRVARTNISFYLIVSLVNIFGLILLASFGENLFSVSHNQFLQLRTCFIILSLFASISWCTTAFNQLLIAYKKFDYTMKVQCIMVLLKGGLITSVFIFNLSLSQYFFYLTLIIAAAIIPYGKKCLKDKLIDSIVPSTHWKDFKIVLTFSLSIFALSLFQVSATQSRPIILSIFSLNGADTVADFRIIEVIPQFIITACGTFTSIFLPKSSEMLVKNNHNEIQTFVNFWTIKTTILVCILCFPFIIGGRNILGAYIGTEYEYLYPWLQFWCIILILQMHSSPAFSFILAHGRTKVLILTTGIACCLSIIINILLCKILPVGSAVISYASYIICLIGVYYFYIYPKYLKLYSIQIFLSFLRPLLIGILCCIFPILVNIDNQINQISTNVRIICLISFFVQSFLWLVPFIFLLNITGIYKLKKL